MFQAEPILWLQSFDSPILIWAMAAVSALGDTPVYIALILGLAFGYKLRPSLSVLLALLVAGILIQSLKDGFALPRPSQIDERVEEPADPEPTQPQGRGAAVGFWELPAEPAIAAVRAVPEASFGLPSGHVGSAVAFFLAAAYFFRSRAVLIFALLWTPLMAVSRMYLGRHFLIDVLGGVVVGLVGVGIAAVVLRPLGSENASESRLRALAPLAGLVLALMFLAPFVPVLDAENLGRLLGLSLVFGWLVATGPASDAGTPWIRLGRVAVAVLVYLAVSRAVESMTELAQWDGARFSDFLSAFLVTGVTLAGSVTICSKLRLYGD